MIQEKISNPKIYDVDLKSIIYNASGPRCTSLDELMDLNNSKSGAILTKSCTVEPREGNTGTRYWENDNLSINATGLANKGYKYYNTFCQVFQEKPYIISVAGLTLQDNITIISSLRSPDLIELNLSCPNLCNKSQVAYDFDTMDDYLHRIFESVDNSDSLYGSHKIGLKLSPYFDQGHFTRAAEIIEGYPVRFVTSVNSLGNGFMFSDSYQPSIDANNGYGGVGGSVILPFALANVRRFRQLLPDRIDIIGCGGIVDGRDIYKHLLVGASAVQVGTQFQKEGCAVFTRLLTELREVMKTL